MHNRLSSLVVKPLNFPCLVLRPFPRYHKFHTKIMHSGENIDILVIDFLKKGNRDSSFLVSFLKEKGFSVDKPSDIREFIKSTDFSNNLPRSVLYLHPLEEEFFKDFITALDLHGVPFFNSLHGIDLVSDRLWLKLTLKKNNLPTPDFFYGHPSKFNESWRGKILKLRNGEDNLVLFVNHDIHTQDRVVFLEELIQLPKGYVDTIFVVGDDMFQTAKNDSLGLYPKQDLFGEKDLDPELAFLAKKVGEVTNLTFFSVDFVGGKIIDVNPFPNIFWDRSFPAIARFFNKFLKK